MNFFLKSIGYNSGDSYIHANTSYTTISTNNNAGGICGYNAGRVSSCTADVYSDQFVYFGYLSLNNNQSNYCIG